MNLSLAEIRQNAIRFSKEWKDASRERADAQTFWNEFFAVFGRSRKLVATFEEPVKNLKGQYEFIDLFWPGTLIAEHKSRGKDLDKAGAQAVNYIHHLANNHRFEETPSFLVISDFARIALHNLEDESASIEFPLEDLHKHIRQFAFIAGYQTRKLDPEDPANFQAVEKLANLHDQLEEAHFTGHQLERFLVRILFCLFAEDTEIFEPESFKLFLLNHTEHDGSDLGPKLAQLFQVLDTPPDQRDPNLSEDIAAFPHVNGELFRETLRFPTFTSRQREALMNCARFQWSKISPAIFGSLFQAAMQPKERRQIGAHYTSERDIMKLIRSLFLDDLRAEFDTIKTQKKKLEAFHDKLASLKFLDPACGCGNFLVITYRELRLLELDVLKALHPKLDALLNIATLLRVNVDQMYGIEIEEWPARIAEVALWLLDHQMNQLASQTFGNHYARLPLKAAPAIHVANALRINWRVVIDKSQCSYVLGNPPFVGSKFQSPQQRQDMEELIRLVDNGGLLDYVTGWYLKASEFVSNTTIKVAFVSTNSITQGEQAATLWHALYERRMSILFAHRTFVWQSEAKGKAHVHVVIIGFGVFDLNARKIIYEYGDSSDEFVARAVENISPYLISGSDRAVTSRSTPLCDVPPFVSGNKPIDDGNYLFTPAEKKAFIEREPASARLFRRWYGGDEFLNGTVRWYLWLADTPIDEIKTMPFVWARVEAVRAFRNKSTSKPTKAIANQPTHFHTTFSPTKPFLALPQVSSERRAYIPMAFMRPKDLCGDKLRLCPGATLFHFGILSSTMHMSWVKIVTGRLKSDFQWSVKLVYNNFPWPSPNPARIAGVEKCAQGVLEAREFCFKKGYSLADIYDPLFIEQSVYKAHRALDIAVDRAYRPQRFPSDIHRFEFLFALYEQLIAPLTATPKKKRSQS
ncbi:MAG TPA: DNA methyltransferase [Phycisphaerae bacterium]